MKRMIACLLVCVTLVALSACCPKTTEPIAQPAEPVAQPAEPVDKPAEPVAKPAEPVAKPAEPVAKPAEPAAQPVAGKLKVLFLCTGNSCRSQMAEAWAHKLKSDCIIPYSAGIEKHGLNPNMLQVMKEAGVDTSMLQSKLLSEIKGVTFDYVVTVCAHADKNCPELPKTTIVKHIGFDDPPKLAKECKTEEEKLNCYRRVRDEIKKMVESLPDNLTKGEEK